MIKQQLSSEVHKVDGGNPLHHCHGTRIFLVAHLSFRAIFHLRSDSYKCDVTSDILDHEVSHRHKFAEIPTECLCLDMATPFIEHDAKPIC